MELGHVARSLTQIGGELGMDGAVPVIAVVAVVAVFAILGRFASAFAKRLEHPPREAAPPDPAVGELRQELEALQERLDFIERVLATQ